MHPLLQLKVIKRDSYDGRGHKAASTNRDDYFAQSRMTTNGYRPTIAEARALRAAEYAATAAPDQFYDADLHSAFALKY